MESQSPMHTPHRTGPFWIRTASPRLVPILAYAAPPGYPMPAPPYPYPMIAPPQPKTPQGIGYVRWSVLLGAVMQAIAIPGYVVFAVLLNQVQATTFPPDFSTTFGLVAAALLFAFATGIVGLIAVIFFVLGFYYIHEGRDEYGPDHNRQMDRALAYLIVAFVMAIVASIGGFSPLGSSLGGPAAISEVTSWFGAVRGLFVGLLLMSLVNVFISKEDRTLGWVGTIILAAVPAITSALYIVLFLTFTPSNPTSIFGALFAALIIAAALSAAELVAFLLFYLLYAKVVKRMRAGEFPAAVRAPMVFPPYYPAPMYYPPYPVYPSYPPPAPPPTPPPEKPP